MKFQDPSVHGSKVPGGIKSVTDGIKVKPKAICPVTYTMR